MITEIFYQSDEFCKLYNKEISSNLISSSQRKRNKPSIMTPSEVITICIQFHFSGYRTFKHYYLFGVCNGLKDCFPNLVSYNRFLELKKENAFAIAIFSMLMNSNECTGVSFVDSFPLKVCHNKRIYSHKTFKRMAKRGVSSMGWFFGFKLHIVINHNGEILSFCITPGNAYDSNNLVMKTLTKNLWGKLFGDKGYLGEKLFQSLWKKGVEMVTKVRKNMKQKIMSSQNKALMNKRNVVESVENVLKNTLSIEHSRHRSTTNFFVHICSALLSYSFKKEKPSISLKASCILG